MDGCARLSDESAELRASLLEFGDPQRYPIVLGDEHIEHLRRGHSGIHAGQQVEDRPTGKSRGVQLLDEPHAFDGIRGVDPLAVRRAFGDEQTLFFVVAE